MAVGGAQESAIVAARGLSSPEFESVLLSGLEADDEGSLWAETAADGVRVVPVRHLVRAAHPVRDLLALLWLVRWCRRWRPDVVHTHSSKAGLVGRIAARLAGVPHVVHSVHGWSFNDEMPRRERALAIALERIGARFADVLIVESSTDLPKGLARRIGRRADYMLIRNGIDLERFRSARPDRARLRASLGVPEDCWLAGTVGRVADQKDPLAMVAAWRAVHVALPDAHFVWVGDGPLRGAVEAEARAAGLEKTFHVVGVRRDVAEVLATLDAFALSSLWEGLPRTLSEAMAAGVPVVATAVDGTTEAIDHEHTGLLVAPKRPRALAAALVRLHDDVTLSTRLSAGGEERAAWFDRKVMLDDLGELYRTLSAGTPVGTGHRPIVIAHVITGLGVGGAEKQLAQMVLAMGLPAARHVVFSLTTVGETGRQLLDAGIDVRAIGLSSGRPDPTAVLRLRAALREVAPDVVQTWLYHGDLIGGIAARTVGLPVVWNVRMSAMAAQETKRHTRAAARVSALLSRVVPHAIVCNSQSAVDDHAALGFDRKRMSIISNGVDSQRFHRDESARRALRVELAVDEATPLVGLVGRFDPQKDHRTFLEAMALVAAHRPDAHVVLCGQGLDGVDSLVSEIAGGCFDRKNIHALGARIDVERITAALDVSVSSSAYGESFPNAVAEAMACEVPVVVTDLPGSVALVDGIGSVVPTRDPAALAQAIEAALELDSPTRASLGARARARIVEQFDVQVSCDQYRDLYLALR
jgi:glycosyltransferase involved in cell wall biosynthesis